MQINQAIYIFKVYKFTKFIDKCYKNYVYCILNI